MKNVPAIYGILGSNLVQYQLLFRRESFMKERDMYGVRCQTNKLFDLSYNGCLYDTSFSQEQYQSFIHASEFAQIKYKDAPVYCILVEEIICFRVLRQCV